MPYQSYQPTWNNPYLSNPYLPQFNQGQPVQPYQQSINGITKVNGRDSALQYQLPPNSTSPALFDKSGTCFYIVTTDGTMMGHSDPVAAIRDMLATASPELRMQVRNELSNLMM